MTCATTPDLTIYQGDDKTFRLSVVDGDGVAVDISGWADITFVAKDDRTGTASVISKSLGSGIALVGGGTTGLADITVDAADTADEEPRTLIFAVRGEDDGAKIRTLKIGYIEIQENVTD